MAIAYFGSTTLDQRVGQGAESPAMSGATAGALATVDPASILARYLDDEPLKNVAASLGVHRSALNQLLLRTVPEGWRDVQAARALTAYEDAKEALDDCSDALSLARAREQVRTRQWELERLLKRLYGPSQEITGKDGGPLAIEIVRFAGRTLEGESVSNAVDNTSAGAQAALCQVDKSPAKLPTK